MALTRPFAQNGDKLAIPETASDSSVSYNLGFTYAYALPPEEGGKFIDRAQFNQLMYDTTSQVLANKTAISNLNSATYSKTEVNNLLNAKANANATVNLAGAQTIQGVKTFSAPPVSATNPTANNQVANKAYVDSQVATKAGFITRAIRIGANEEIKNLNEFKLYAMRNFANYYNLSITSDIEVNESLEISGLHFRVNPTTYKIKVNAPISFLNSSIVFHSINFEFGAGGATIGIQSSIFAINGDTNITDNAGANTSRFLFFLHNSKVAFGVGDTWVINSPKETIFALSSGTTLAFMTMNISGNIGGKLVAFDRPSLLFTSGSTFDNLTVTDIAQNTLTNKGIWFKA